mmetsp:Transcript_522/g.844  ORF Transcript_522/g.844 Transcript_522/m.844 type:complete len:209 (+) Transcript_522:795-1421(+)
MVIPALLLKKVPMDQYLRNVKRTISPIFITKIAITEMRIPLIPTSKIIILAKMKILSYLPLPCNKTKSLHLRQILKTNRYVQTQMLHVLPLIQILTLSPWKNSKLLLCSNQRINGCSINRKRINVQIFIPETSAPLDLNAPDYMYSVPHDIHPVMIHVCAIRDHNLSVIAGRISSVRTYFIDPLQLKLLTTQKKLNRIFSVHQNIQLI